MIWESIESAIAGILSNILGALPNAGDLGLSVPDGILLGYAWLNSFLPVAEVVTGVALIVTIMAAVFAARLVLAAANLFRGSGAG